MQLYIYEKDVTPNRSNALLEGDYKLMIPSVGDLVSVNRKLYKVVQRTYDYGQLVSNQNSIICIAEFIDNA